MKYPFKFLDAYTKEDQDIFFGREQEVEDLYKMVFQTNLLLVYGASGTGKTSLIRCGLANRFKDTQWLDLYIRRGTDINRSVLESIQKATTRPVEVAESASEMEWFEELVAEQPGAVPASETDQQSEHPISKALEALYLTTFTPIYLIFDQFEELYTLGRPEEQQRFIQVMEELVRIPLPVKIIIVMREEYLARLYDLERAIPQLRSKKLRIEAMDLSRVERIILQATLHNPNSNIHLQRGSERELARLIVERIREGDVNVKLPYLQVFMDRLYEQASGDATAREREVTIDLALVQCMGNIGDVLDDFIEREGITIYYKLKERYNSLSSDIAWRFLSPFATLDGTKIPIKEADLHLLEKMIPPAIEEQHRSGLLREALAELENSRIIRYRKDDQTYEVAHDTLARQIAEKRSEEEKTYLKARRIVTEGRATYQDTETLLSKEQLIFIAPYELRMREELGEDQWAYIMQSRQERDRQQKRLQRGIMAAFVAALAVILIVLWQQRRTQQALDEMLAAQAAREKTELNTMLQNAAQIAKGENCPPISMKHMIDSLYEKHRMETGVQQQYQKTMERLTHCNY